MAERYRGVDQRPREDMELLATSLSDIRDSLFDGGTRREDLSQEPQGRPESGLTVSNIALDDGEEGFIPDGLEEALRRGEMASHSAWNFWGRLWFTDGLFHEEIWQYRVPIAVLNGESAAEVVRKANDAYGWD